ncbi:MAG TPA: hypothetical protein DCK95_03190 [Anaerolineaceae bacterium]|uniref:Thymidylate synthase complementing protein ThyX family protein n=1 Tax=Anaerolinea thermophila TaxID=167964 RepID=A0A101FXX5_9CHLR|nr:MAG: Thymidylate synthase complementing protein ThyX family protein [Anaerolinea thermophila]HAF61313.1 hypothetical protein [Anaerolineaceae bacterium]
MENKRHIYLLDSKKISPETIAVTFAKTSRSPQSFEQIAQELSDESSAQFHEKWVVGYGHASIAEHAVLHIAVENISRLAVECLESNRLASYTEKSSRYQVWDAENFFTPDELKDSQFSALYHDTVHMLFQRYQKAIPVLQKTIEATKQAQGESISEREVHACCMDVCRYYLPAAATANVGITINARSLENALCKMLSHPLAEVRQIGSEIKQVAITHLPTLVKYVDEIAYLKQAEERTTQLAQKLNPSYSKETDQWCTLVDHDVRFEDHILNALLYRFDSTSFSHNESSFQKMPQKQQEELLDILFGKLGEHDIPLRELEYSWFLFDILMDQGAYFEFKRHRMMTQTVQPLSPHDGFAIPRLITQAGLEVDFREAMQMAKAAYQQIAQVERAAASYVIPNAFNRRVLSAINLRSALHLIQLRTAPNAHFAIRRVANRMAELLREQMHLFTPYFKPQTDETWQQIEDDYFSTTKIY